MEIGHNTTSIEVQASLDETMVFVSDFVLKHFSAKEFTTITLTINNGLLVGFGFSLNDYSRVVGTIIYKEKNEPCCIVINNFAKKRFIEFMDESGIKYKELE